MSATRHARANDAGLAAALALAMLTVPACARQAGTVQPNVPPAANAEQQVTLDRVVGSLMAT